ARRRFQDHGPPAGTRPASAPLLRGPAGPLPNAPAGDLSGQAGAGLPDLDLRACDPGADGTGARIRPLPHQSGVRRGALLDSGRTRSYLGPIFSGSESPSRGDRTKVNAMATVKVTDAGFSQDVLNSSEPVVVDFWAE